MEDIKLVLAANEHVDFLNTIMNDPQVLTALREVPTSAQDWEEAVTLWDQDPDEEDYIVFLGDQPVGWLGVNELASESKTVSLKMAVLLPQYQNTGIGAKAISLLIDNLRTRGFSRVVLYTDQDNIRAQRCYKKCGFFITTEFGDVMSNGDNVMRYRMDLPLYSI